ncbi:MAG: AMP-binding protein [Syntrophomonadaceae bacterium]
MKSKELARYHLHALEYFSQNQQCSLGSVIELQAQEQPRKTAIIFAEQVITFAELNRRSNQYSHFFTEQGFRKGDTVALLMSNRPEFLMALTGLAKAGIKVGLINCEMRGEVLCQSINLLQARGVIVGHEYLDLYQSIAKRVRLYAPTRILVETEDREINLPPGYENLCDHLRQAKEENPESTRDIYSNDVLAYIYTSGNFGPRKAVAIQHKRFLLVGHQAGAFCHMGPDTVQYVAVPLYMNIGLNLCFGGLVVNGCTMVLKKRFSVSQFWADVKKYQINYLVGVGEMCRYLLSMPENNDDKNNSLQVVICNGLAPELMEPFRQRFNVEHIIEIYGTTENVGFFINHQEIPGMCGNLTLGGVRQGEVVRCDSDDTNQLLRDKDGKAIKCLPGETGVLLCEINNISGFTGYLGDPEASASKIIYNVFNEGDSYLNTHDLVQLHYGDYISFVDRLGNTYRWKGKTVSADQVADVILKFFGPVEDAVVYGVKVPHTEGRCGMAVLKLLEGEKLNWPKFVDYLDRRMPEHARPVFLRIITQLEGMELLEKYKPDLKRQGYSPVLISDPLYYFNLEKSTYCPLTLEVYESIQEGRIRL